jgi:hypothetical protein
MRASGLRSLGAPRRVIDVGIFLPLRKSLVAQKLY